MSTVTEGPRAAAAERPRQTQADRSRETRAKLMAAVVECLNEVGWAGTTTTLVSRRAGVSRGAQLHHFATRGELVAAAVEHLGTAGVAELRRSAEARSDPTLQDRSTRTRAVVDLLVGTYLGPIFAAALELWVAARTDAALRTVVEPLQARLGAQSHRLAVELLGADESRPGVREAVQATLDLARGLALADQLVDDSARRARIVDQWAAQLDTVLRGPA
ncbi:TetR family transcriptional regulator [Rhodococcus aerolatus]